MVVKPGEEYKLQMFENKVLIQKNI